MNEKNELWKGLRADARAKLGQRDYQNRALEHRLANGGVEAGELADTTNLADDERSRLAAAWIPGVEIFSRAIYPQRHRGFFGEFARPGEGVLGKIGFLPKQWATARMFANTAKGFHIHPPHIPDGESAEAWFHRLFHAEPENYALRPYDREQWDVMFFAQGIAEMVLVDERVGMERRVMRFIVEGDSHCGANNVGVVIPAGVAHAIRAASSDDLIMVYGTSTTFNPEFEGRIASGVESAPLPAEWAQYLAGE